MPRVRTRALPFLSSYFPALLIVLIERLHEQPALAWTARPPLGWRGVRARGAVRRHETRDQRHKVLFDRDRRGLRAGGQGVLQYLADWEQQHFDALKNLYNSVREDFFASGNFAPF